jgi:inner membrane protein
MCCLKETGQQLFWCLVIHRLYVGQRERFSFVDVLTHGLTVSLFLAGLNAGSLLFAGILGSVAPDLDFLLTFLSARNPRWYILIHGGITHSLAGGIPASLLAFGVALVIAVRVPVLQEGGIVLASSAVIALLGGTLLHLFLDLLAYPGIPLRWPASDRKYTLGIFPGPSLFLFGLTILFLVPFFLGVLGPEAFFLYAAVFVVFVLLSTVLKVLVSSRVTGAAIPTRHPLRWLVLADENDSYRLSRYHLLRGPGGEVKFAKLDGVTSDEVSRYRDLPEVKRLYYHSYAVTVRRDGKDLVFRDPLRDEKIIFYPPYYEKVRVGEDRRIEG